MLNPRSYAVKKYVFDTLKEKYSSFNDLIERISIALITEQDAIDFAKLLGTYYEIGYMNAVEQHREQLSKLGFQAIVTQSRKEEHSIFNHPQNMDENQK